MPHNENSRVKIPALVHFTRLGYKYISLRKYEGVIDDDTNILVDVLCDAINRINATSLTTTDVQKIVNALKAMLENDDLGREFYSVLINGYNGLKLIDFEDFGGTVNSYHVVTEMTCKNGSDEFRPDITPLINGIPLAFIEVKKPNNKGGIKAEYDRMLMRVKNKKFRRFINLTQIMVFSNNSEYDDTEAVPLEGAFYSTISYEKLFFSHFREEDEKLLTSVPEKDEAVENFILTDNNLSSIKYSPEYVTNSSPVSPTNRIITSLFSFERMLQGGERMKYKLLKDLYDCFCTPPELQAQKQEIDECHQALSKVLGKLERRLVLQIIDAKDRIAEETSIDSFIAGFELAWKLSVELNHYENERSVSCQTAMGSGARFASKEEEK